MCKDCYECLRKPKPEMPVFALANGRWLGRHPEIMRSMPYGHRLLLPVRRVIATRVVFTANKKSEWERSHSQKGMDGVAIVTEQASGAKAILEYPPKDLGGSFHAIFAGIDPNETEKAQCFPIDKALFLRQHEFLQLYSEPNKLAPFHKADVEKWDDGETPQVIKDCYAPVPEETLEEEDAAADSSTTKYRGPVDSTLGAQESGESTENEPWSFLCPDAAEQELDEMSCWQVAARKLQQLQEESEAIRREEELAGLLQDISGIKD